MKELEYHKWIREWALSDEEYVPMQDMHLMLADVCYVEDLTWAFLNAREEKKVFFLGCLYSTVAQLVRQGSHRTNLGQDQFNRFVAQIRQAEDRFLDKLATRGTEIMAGSVAVDYDLWFNEGYAKEYAVSQR